MLVRSHTTMSLFVAAALVLVSPALQDEAPPSRALLMELASEPRLAGTTGSLRGAKCVARHLEAAGWKVEFDEREVLLSLPRRLSFAYFDDASASEPVERRVERFDPDAIPAGDIPLFNAWTASGKARGKVVDVGFGLRADYERLAADGVDVRGAIALAKYGRAYRGVKAQMAEEFGCAGVMLYSDPASDGGEKGAVWPDGPWKPDWDAQRGSILPVASAPGDPSTPGWASPKPGEAGKRLSREEIDAKLPKIPCLPIGAGDARKLQSRLALRGEARVGPGPVEVELDLEAPRDLRTIRNVIATMPGETDELVIAGGHRDSWVRGANDNAGGCVALIRAAQHLGERARAGWKPRMTILIAFWDAEELGLIGSTEWGEANAESLRSRGLVYVNCDASVGGTQFGAGGSPGMLGAIEAAAKGVKTADGARSLWEDWCEREKSGAPDLGLPGAGSDHTVFAHHLGIPVVEPGFGGTPGAGQYHTTFDDFALIDRFLDPTWRGHELAGKFLAALLADLAAKPHSGFSSSEAARTFAKHARGLSSEPWCGADRAERLAAALEQLATKLAEPGHDAAHLYRALDREFAPAERSWFRNVLWAPDTENGYRAETFPSLRAAAKHGEATLDAELERLVRDVLAAAGA